MRLWLVVLGSVAKWIGLNRLAGTRFLEILLKQPEGLAWRSGNASNLTLINSLPLISDTNPIVGTICSLVPKGA